MISLSHLRRIKLLNNQLKLSAQRAHEARYSSNKDSIAPCSAATAEERALKLQAAALQAELDAARQVCDQDRATSCSERAVLEDRIVHLLDVKSAARVPPRPALMPP